MTSHSMVLFFLILKRGNTEKFSSFSIDSYGFILRFYLNMFSNSFTEWFF